MAISGDCDLSPEIPLKSNAVKTRTYAADDPETAITYPLLRTDGGGRGCHISTVTFFLKTNRKPNVFNTTI